MKRGIYVLPNLFTIGNLFCGFWALVAVLQGMYARAAMAILAAGVLDGLDGKIARLTHTTSRFGVEFDSLADVVSFGVAPGILVYMWGLQPLGRLGWSAAFLFAICGALRLARFNVQVFSSESRHFTGLPIPAAAGVIASLVIFCEHFGLEAERQFLILFLVYTLAALMVSTVKYRSLKELDLRQKRPFSLLVAASLVLFLVAAEPQVMLLAIFSLYAASGVFERLVLRQYLLRRSKAKALALKSE